MNLRLSILLVAVLLLFGGTFLIIRLTSTPERTPDEDWMYRISEDDLYHIEVSNEGKTAVYKRAPGSFRWYIQGDPPVPVFNAKWAGTPLLLSGPRVNRTLTEVIEDPAIYGLDPPASRVYVVDGAGQSFEFHMGSPTPDESNQYTRLVGHSELFTVPAIWAQVINRLALEPPYLRLYQLEEEDQIVFIQVTDQGKTIDYGWDRDNIWYYLGPPPEEGAAKDPEDRVPVDAQVWEDVLTFIDGPRLDDIILDDLDDPAEYGLDEPSTTVRLGKVTGPDIKFHLGDTTPDGNHRYVILESDEDTKLYSMRNDRAETITSLVSNPPLGEPPDPTPTPP